MLNVKKLENKSGSALLLTTILMFVILSMVVSLTYVTVMEQKMSQKTKSSVGAFYGAESGVEWALNNIATGAGTTIAAKLGATTYSNTSNEGLIPCPFTGCNVYFLDKDGKVIPKAQFSGSPELVKAVRSVGDQGDETQRAIEAAVASGGGGCYVDYSLDTNLASSLPSKHLAVGSPCKVSGFTVKGSAGVWGRCSTGDRAHYLPPGGVCTNYGGFGISEMGEAYLCCM
jgi:hypothetical protein